MPVLAPEQWEGLRMCQELCREEVQEVFAAGKMNELPPDVGPVCCALSSQVDSGMTEELHDHVCLPSSCCLCQRSGK